MDITIQGVNGHVNKHKSGGGGTGAAAAAVGAAEADTRSLHSPDSFSAAAAATATNTASASETALQKPMDSLKLPGFDYEKLGYSSDMSIGRGMDISIRGDGDFGDDNKEFYDGGGWGDGDGGVDDENAVARGVEQDYYDSKEKIEYDMEPQQDKCEKLGSSDVGSLLEHGAVGKNMEEVLEDPVDDVVVEKCCPEICYRMCPCCIGDPDSPFWQLWYRHRLQVSR